MSSKNHTHTQSVGTQYRLADSMVLYLDFEHILRKKMEDSEGCREELLKDKLQTKHHTDRFVWASFNSRM